MATFFSYAYYDGAFGTYTVDESSTEESATVTHEGARTSNIVFTVSEDVDEDYVAGADAINAYIEKYPTLMGASPERLEIEGFERFLGYKYDVNMSMGPTSVTFTCILFVASYGDTVIDAYTTNQYVMDTFATDDDIDALMDAILLSVGA